MQHIYNFMMKVYKSLHKKEDTYDEINDAHNEKMIKQFKKLLTMQPDKSTYFTSGIPLFEFKNIIKKGD